MRFLWLLTVWLLAACAGDETGYVERPAETLYAEALAARDAGDYPTAAERFEEVDRQHPYSQWAIRAQLMAAHAYYQEEAYEEAIATADRFLQLHPGNDGAAYAAYLRAISLYEQIVDVQRDQSVTEQAATALREVVRRWPETDYARDAQLKLDLTQDHLAGKELAIGRWYQGQTQCVAAIGRYRRVIERYQTTSQVPEALHRLVECALTLGLRSEAEAAAAVLGTNFPGSAWYADSYALVTAAGGTPQPHADSWLGRVFGDIF